MAFVDDDGVSWEIDREFLMSRYRCIYGNGCQGVLEEPTPELHQGCCSFGAQFVDDDDVQQVVRAFVRLGPDQMQYFAEANADGFLDAAGDPTGDHVTTTRVVDGACIFLNRPDFGRGPGCALHVAALDHDERPVDWKPNVCWQLPLKIDRVAAPDGSSAATPVRLRRWTRDDWGDDRELGGTMAWWCTEAPEALVGDHPVAVSLRDEIVEMIGDRRYGQLLDALGVSAEPDSDRQRDA